MIPLERSGRNPEVEEVLGALSLLLNGGGVAQLKTITSELNNALEGREGSATSVLSQVRLLMSQLDDNKADIVEAIEALNRLSIEISASTSTPSTRRSTSCPAPSTRSTGSATTWSGCWTPSTTSAGSASGSSGRPRPPPSTAFEQLDPVLTQLAAAGDDFANAFHVFLTYPFVDEVVGRDPQVARNLHMGDYTNLSIQLEVDLSDVVPTVPLPSLPIAAHDAPDDPAAQPARRRPCCRRRSTRPRSSTTCWPASPAATSTAPSASRCSATVQGILELQEECKKPENAGHRGLQGRQRRTRCRRCPRRRTRRRSASRASPCRRSRAGPGARRRARHLRPPRARRGPADGRATTRHWSA